MLKLITVGIVALLTATVQGQNIPEFLKSTSSSQYLTDSKRYSFKNNGINQRPIIGVLTQPLTDAFKKDPKFANKTSYIMSSYIDVLESAGARTVPLIFDAPLEEELAKL